MAGSDISCQVLNDGFSLVPYQRNRRRHFTWRKVARSGGHAQGILMGWPLGPFTAPSQSPVPTYVSQYSSFPKSNAQIPPVGFTPEWKPRSGASREISAGLVRFPGAALMAACWARRVVDTAGQPWPGPWRFCSVMREAMIRAFFEALELSVGNVTAIGGLLTACPAATLAFRA